MTNPVYIIGHKNPDTDSVCSAMTLAEFKQKQGINAIPARLGHLNVETLFILSKLGIDKPLYLTTAKSTIEELNVDTPVTLNEKETVLKGWNACATTMAKTVYCVNDNDEFSGAATIGEIAELQMKSVEEKRKLLKESPLDNIVETLNGRYIIKGTIEHNGVVQLSDPSVAEQQLEGTIIILRAHEDQMIRCIANGCACIVISDDFQPVSYIVDMAKAYGVTLISTPYNTMDVIQLIYRSISLSSIMTPAKNIVSFNKNEYLDEVEKTMLETRHAAYPIISSHNHVKGSISRYHILKKSKKEFILVDHNEKKQTISDIDMAEVVEIVDHHRIGDIETSKPIVFRNMTVGSTCTIVALMFKESGIQMSEQCAKLTAYGIISDTMNFHSPTCTSVDVMVKDSLEKKFNISFNDMATELFENTATIKGKDFSQLLYTDVKEYILSGYQICVSQTFTYNLSDVDEIEKDFQAYMEEQNTVRNFPCHLMAFTNVEGKGSRYIVVGRFADQVRKVLEDPITATYVSRKKQFVPMLAQALA